MQFTYKISYIENNEEKIFYTSSNEKITFNIRRDNKSNIFNLVYYNDDLSSNNSLITLYDILVTGKKTITNIKFYLIIQKDNEEEKNERFLYSFENIKSLNLDMNLRSNVFVNPDNDYDETNERIALFETNLRIG